VDAALAASVFHSGAIVISELKRQLRESGIEVRPAEAHRVAPTKAAGTMGAPSAAAGSTAAPSTGRTS